MSNFDKTIKSNGPNILRNNLRIMGKRRMCFRPNIIPSEMRSKINCFNNPKKLSMNWGRTLKILETRGIFIILKNHSLICKAKGQKNKKMLWCFMVRLAKAAHWRDVTTMQQDIIMLAIDCERAFRQWKPWKGEYQHSKYAWPT